MLVRHTFTQDIFAVFDVTLNCHCCCTKCNQFATLLLHSCMLYCVSAFCSPLSCRGSLKKPPNGIQLHCSYPHNTSNGFLFSAVIPSTMAIEVPSYPQCIHVRYISQGSTCSEIPFSLAWGRKMPSFQDAPQRGTASVSHLSHL